MKRKSMTEDRPVPGAVMESQLVQNNENASRDSFREETYRPPIDFGPLKHVDWADTSLGEMQSWPPSLRALASLLVTLPYAAAIFWGQDLIMIHNTPWQILSGSMTGQGKSALGLLNVEAIGRLKATMSGHVQDTESSNFFRGDQTDVKHLQTLLHPLCGEGRRIEGVMAQFISRTNNSISQMLKPKQKDEAHLEDRDSSDRDSEVVGEAGTSRNGHDNSVSIMQDLPIDGRILFQKFAHMIPTGLAILNSDAEALFVNDLFYKLTTHQGANPFRAWPQSIHSDDYDRVMKEYKKAFGSDQIFSTQFRSASQGEFDSPAWRMFMMRSISDRAPIAQDGFICAIIDITSLKAAEENHKRVASEAIERKKQQEKFMDMISHEIRNPLSAILHCSEGIIESVKGSPEVGDSIEVDGVLSKNHIVDQACLDDIVEAAETVLFCVAHQKNIVDDILSFSKLDAMMLSLSPAPFQPDQKFAQYLRIFQPELREKSISINFALDPSYPEAKLEWVNADMVRINQVLVNLMTNAIKFTARKDGERNITVSMGASLIRPTSYPPSVVFFQDEEAAHRMDATLGPEWGEGQMYYLLVAVRDTGIGISDEDQARLFERFRQATPKTQEEYGGSGLGLFISRKLCQLHGGDIGVSSKAGSGSTFGFFFKIRRIQPPKPKDIDKRESDMQNTSLVPRNPPVDAKTPKSLINPPIEDRKEVHPAVSSDERYRKTAKIAARVDEKIKADNEVTKSENAREEQRKEESSGGENRTEDEPEHSGNPLSSKSQNSKEDDSTDAEQHRQPESKKQGAQSEAEKKEMSGSHEPTRRLDTGEDQAKADSIKPRTAPPRQILLVEDNKINQRVLKRHLQTKGFHVVTANNGQEAVDAHKARIADQEQNEDRAEEGEARTTDSGQFDCILMDQEMPVMDGNTATKTIRKNEQQKWAESVAHRIPVLGISANVRDAQRNGMLQAGMDDVISKPFSMADLIKRIHDMIERGSNP